MNFKGFKENLRRSGLISSRNTFGEYPHRDSCPMPADRQKRSVIDSHMPSSLELETVAMARANDKASSSLALSSSSLRNKLKIPSRDIRNCGVPFNRIEFKINSSQFPAIVSVFAAVARW